MAPTPRSSLSDDYVAHLKCPICGETSLVVHHTEALPDYVACGKCASAFVVEEGGEQVLFGKINNDYPRTQQFALRQWNWLEAIERRASDERLEDEVTRSPIVPTPPEPEIREEPLSTPAAEDLLRSAAVPIPTEPDLGWPPQAQIPLEPEPDSEPIPSEPLYAGPPAPEIPRPAVQEPAQPPPASMPPIMSDLREPAAAVSKETGIPQKDEVEEEPLIDTPVFPGGMKLEQPPEGLPEQPSPPKLERIPPRPEPTPVPQPIAAAEPPALDLRESDPPPGIRYRVVIRGEKVSFPKKACAHCHATPARGRLAVIGDLPQGQKIGQRKKARFNLPLCADCHDRAQNVSPQEKNERLQSHLVATLVAMVFLVAALAWGVDLQDDPVPGVIILATLGIIGYSVPAYFLLARVPPTPPTPNSAFIRSTLLVPEEAQGLETAFEFRNKDYADQFFNANEHVALGRPVQVKDRLFAKPEPPEASAS